MDRIEPTVPTRKMTFTEWLFIGALIARCGWLIGMIKTPFWKTPLVDALVYHELALKINSDGWLPTSVFERTPLYPYLIAIVYQLVGSEPFWIRMLQACIGAVNVVLIYRISSKIFNESVGRVAGIIAACYGMFWIHEADLLAPVWVIFFMLLSIIFALPTKNSNTSPILKLLRPLASGLSMGLAILAWPTVTFAAPGIWHIVGRSKDPDLKNDVTPKRFLARQMAAIDFRATLLVIVATLILPMSLVGFQYIRFGEPMLSLQGGVNLYLGNNPSSDGFSAIMPGIGPAWSFDELRADLDRKLNHHVSWLEFDRYYRNEAIRFFLTEPVMAARLWLQKFLFLIMPTEIPNTFDPYVLSMAYPWAKSALVVGWWLIFPMAIVGIALRCRKLLRNSLSPFQRTAEQGLWIAQAGLAIGVMLFFINMRYRLPLVPLLIPFAGVTAVSIWEQRKSIKQLLVPSVATLLLIGILKIDFSHYGGDGGTYGMMQLAIAFRDQQNFEQAEHWFNSAMEVNPGYPSIRHELARLAIRRGDYFDAKRLADEEVQVSQSTPFKIDVASVLQNIGTIYGHLGMLDSAEFCFRESLARNPSYFLAQKNLWRTRLQIGVQAFLANDSTKAIAIWQQIKQEAGNQPIADMIDKVMVDLENGTLKKHLDALPSLSEFGFEEDDLQ